VLESPGDSVQARNLYEQMRRELDFDPRADLNRRAGNDRRSPRR
jgi:hypothetical protein